MTIWQIKQKSIDNQKNICYNVIASSVNAIFNEPTVYSPIGILYHISQQYSINNKYILLIHI